jgi:hypothetical protein
MEKSVKSIALNYGLYLGIALILINVAIYAIDLKLMANLWLGIIILLALIGFGVYATAKAKAHFNGVLNFKDAFTTYFITTVVGAIISSIFTFILYTIIDPDAAETIKQISIEATINLMEGFNAPAETVAKAVEEAEKVDQFSIENTLKSLVYGAVFQAVIGLIVAAIMKKSNPDA